MLPINELSVYTLEDLNPDAFNLYNIGNDTCVIS